MTQPQPLFTIYEADCSTFSFETADIPRPACVQGLGYGSRDCQQKYAKFDIHRHGPWFEETINVPNGFENGNYFRGIVDAEYDNRQMDMSYRLSGKFEVCPNPGDYVNIVLKDDSIPKTLQVQKVTVRPNGMVMLELGRRKKDEVDAFNAASSLAQIYKPSDLSEIVTLFTNSGTLTIGDVNTDWVGGWQGGSVLVPGGYSSPYIRITLDVTITPPPGVTDECYLNPMIYTSGGQKGASYVFRHYVPGDSVIGIDITSAINFDVAQQVQVACRLYDTAWGGVPPKAEVSATIHALRREFV